VLRIAAETRPKSAAVHTAGAVNQQQRASQKPPQARNRLQGSVDSPQARRHRLVVPADYDAGGPSTPAARLDGGAARHSRLAWSRPEACLSAELLLEPGSDAAQPPV